jgi:hypothetical protein
MPRVVEVVGRDVRDEPDYVKPPKKAKPSAAKRALRRSAQAEALRRDQSVENFAKLIQSIQDSPSTEPSRKPLPTQAKEEKEMMTTWDISRIARQGFAFSGTGPFDPVDPPESEARPVVTVQEAGLEPRESRPVVTVAQKPIQGDLASQRIPQKPIQGDLASQRIPQKPIQGDLGSERIPQKPPNCGGVSTQHVAAFQKEEKNSSNELLSDFITKTKREIPALFSQKVEIPTHFKPFVEMACVRASLKEPVSTDAEALFVAESVWMVTRLEELVHETCARLKKNPDWYEKISAYNATQKKANAPRCPCFLASQVLGFEMYCDTMPIFDKDGNPHRHCIGCKEAIRWGIDRDAKQGEWQEFINTFQS